MVQVHSLVLNFNYLTLLQAIAFLFCHVTQRMGKWSIILFILHFLFQIVKLIRYAPKVDVVWFELSCTYWLPAVF